jgi:cytochrome P450/NADPH-cytochrome P450 reductase
LHEAQIAMATVFQRFDLVLDDPDYTMKLKQNVTIRPDGFNIRAYPRKGWTRLYASLSSPKLPAQTNRAAPALTFTSVSPDVPGRTPLYILYGSNYGTCETLAQRIASDASAHGFRPSVGTLDSAAKNIPSGGPAIIITASFEGKPSLIIEISRRTDTGDRRAC